MAKKYQAAKKWTDNHREIIRENNRKLRERVVKKYGGKCACCKEDRWQFLTIDHKNCDGSQERRELYGVKEGNTRRWYYKLLREKLRADLQVLCFNCNHAIYVFGVCPHKNLGG